MTGFNYLGRKSSKPKDPRCLVITRKGYGDNWPKQRKAALERDNYTCQKCGYKGQQKRRGRNKWLTWDVHVHHCIKIKSFADSETQEVDYEAANDLNNLITLCVTCHTAADGHTPLKGFRMLK